ncbi:MAG: type II secretion system protein [Candidatus Omnitrophica bacterium]|nr:type II secretion system protein [Candidatus Omnitrophota bacterium]
MKTNSTFTLIELCLVIAIIAITVGIMVPRVTAWNRKQMVLSAGQNLFADIVLTQQMALIHENGYTYFGIDFFANQGPDNNRLGYKVLRYEPITVTPPINNTAAHTVIKSFDAADNPQFHEPHMLLSKNIVFSPISTLDENSQIVFNSLGSATRNGTVLIPDTPNTIVLTDTQTTTRIKIEPLTGTAEVY